MLSSSSRTRMERPLKMPASIARMVVGRAGVAPSRAARWLARSIAARGRLPGQRGGIFFDGEREENREGGAADGERFDVDGAAVFANDRGADAEAEAGAAAGTLGGVEGIEKFRERFGENADAVVLDGDGDVGADAADANLNAAGLRGLRGWRARRC